MTVEPLAQEERLDFELQLRHRLRAAILSQVAVNVYDAPLPPPTREQFLRVLLDVCGEIAAGEIAADFAQEPWYGPE